MVTQSALQGRRGPAAGPRESGHEAGVPKYQIFSKKTLFFSAEFDFRIVQRLPDGFLSVPGGSQCPGTFIDSFFMSLGMLPSVCDASRRLGEAATAVRRHG